MSKALMRSAILVGKFISKIQTIIQNNIEKLSTSIFLDRRFLVI
ncbi:hypothetical protein [Dapis sp. BLCC M172]